MTSRRYHCACVFVDHFSDYTYAHLMKAQDGDEVLAAKKAFEATADSHGIRIKHYHADNGIFSAKQWLDDCRDSHQGVTFAGVDSHHQNGRAERKIQSLQELGRCQLLHAAQRWESAVTAHLWPYAVRHAASILNETPCERLGFRTTPTQVFSRTAVEPNTTHWHPLFCPSYVLAQPLRAGDPYDKWKARAAPGIYLGFSPFHARTVALVLNPITGYVSPHFHIVFDPTFSSVNGQDGNRAPTSLWQAKCGFTKRNPPKFAHTTRNDAPPEFMQPIMSAGDTVDNLSQLAKDTNKESTSPAVVPLGTGPSETTTASDAATPANPSDAATSEMPLRSLPPVPQVPAVHPTTAYFEVDPSLQRHSRKGRGTRATRFHEEFGYEAVVSDSNVAGEVFALPTMLPDTVAMNATSDPDTMYFHQAMQQTDAKDFLRAAHEEFQNLVERDIIEIIPGNEDILVGLGHEAQATGEIA